MGVNRLRVVLTMPVSLLSSALQQCLADNPRLEVKVHPPGGDVAGPGTPARTDIARTVRIGLLEDPVRFALDADGREWILEYRSMDGLVRVLADLEATDVVAAGLP